MTTKTNITELVTAVKNDAQLRENLGLWSYQKGREAGDKKDNSTALNALRQQIGDCQRCKLSKCRKNIVFGAGSANSRIVFVGEGPGRDEDLQGEPFVGRAGQLLTKMIKAMGYKREEVYIANIIKCRPPDNRNPEDDEIRSCYPYLAEQLKIIKPAVIIALGKFAAQTLLATETRISRLRGHFHQYQGIPLMPTYHPAYLLRNEGSKREAWEDLKQVMKLLN